jgi:tetratricopeptide (TPR) repeat protein
MWVNRLGAAFLCWQWLLVVVSLTPTASLGAETASHLTRAQTLLAAGHEDAALVELEALLRSEPKNLFALGNAGLILGRRGQFSRAAEYLSRAHNLKPNDVQLGLALLEVSARSGRKGDTERVAADLRNSRKLSGEQALAAAQLLFRTGNAPAAAAMASAGPVNSVERHDLLGSIYGEMGDVQKASDQLQEAIRLAPADDQRYFRLGMLYLKYRTPSLAVLVFGNGVERRPDSPMLWLGLGVSQCLDEKLGPAEISLRKSIELNSHFSDAYLLLGDMLEQERPQEAIKIFRRAMTEHPDLPVAFYYYGRLALQLNEGSIEDTISVLRKAVAMEPSFADSHYELGRALEQAGKVDEAIPEFDKCLQLNPKLFRAQYRLAILYKKRGDAEKANIALKAFQQAQKSEDPDLEMKRLQYEIKQP